MGKLGQEVGTGHRANIGVKAEILRFNYYNGNIRQIVKLRRLIGGVNVTTDGQRDSLSAGRLGDGDHTLSGSFERLKEGNWNIESHARLGNIADIAHKEPFVLQGGSNPDLDIVKIVHQINIHIIGEDHKE